MARYREFAPPPRLADAVECIWVMEAGGEPAPHRVVPDGCADILFASDGSTCSLAAVGAMTNYSDCDLPAHSAFGGLRFRPGMWTSALGIPADRITDVVTDLESLWSARALALRDQLANASTACWPEIFAGAIADPAERTPAQRAIAWLERHRGCASLDSLASQASLSTRQFRRLCIEQAGLTPKLLARILRFRHALSRVGVERGEHAGLAAECGFSDQSHLIAEFHRFAGRTPSTYRRD